MSCLSIAQTTHSEQVAQPIQMQLHVDLSPAERYAYSAAEWIASHRSTFRALMAFMHRQVDAGNPRTQREKVLSWAADQGIEMTDVADLKRNHNLYAALTRYMVMLRPRLARTIHFRESDLDAIDMVAIWRECVDPNTTFFARDRNEARYLVDIDDVSAQ